MAHNFERTHIEILDRAGKLGAVLVQLPPYFREEHCDILLELLSSFSADKYRIFVEVRDKGLYQNENLENKIINAGANLVSIDSPEISLDNNFHHSDRIKYIRLHGRNSSKWWVRNTDRNEKYNYEYNATEIESIKNTILSRTTSGDEIFIYFNNHPSGKAPRNANMMKTILGFEIPKDNQKTLF